MTGGPRNGPGSILISGVGRGIGRATAELFLARGWRVGLYDVDAAAVADGGTVHPNAVSGVLDVLVDNAGVLASGPFAAMAADSHRRMVDVDVTGVVIGAVEGHAFLRRSPRGLLLNLCSASALYGQPTLATYGATKAAVTSLAEALDIEWRADGVRVRSLLRCSWPPTW